jgi:hypothetical protein
VKIADGNKVALHAATMAVLDQLGWLDARRAELRPLGADRQRPRHGRSRCSSCADRLGSSLVALADGTAVDKPIDDWALLLLRLVHIAAARLKPRAAGDQLPGEAVIAS